MNNRIRELRIEKGITQLQLSLHLNTTQETISAYEIGKHMPSLSNLIKLSDILDASIDYIVKLSDIRRPELSSAMGEQDQRLFNYFRLLNQTHKEKVISYAHGLYNASQKDNP